MKKRKPIREEVNEVIEIFDYKTLVSMFQEIQELLQLYDVTEDEDWLENLVGEDSRDEVRLIRTCYIASRMAERFAGRLCMLKMKHPNFWKRLEAEVEGEAAGKE